MGAYLGYTAIIWLIALGVTGKHTFVMSLFDERDSIWEKGMICLLLFPVWAFSVIFLPLFIWYHIQKYREESRFKRAGKDTEYGFYEGWEDQ